MVIDCFGQKHSGKPSFNSSAAKHMRAKIYDKHGVEIFQEEARFYVRYDAGTHMVVPRVDELSQEEADLAMTGPTAADQVLFSLQRRLEAAGIDPYRPNV